MIYANKENPGHSKISMVDMTAKPTAWKRATEIIAEPCVVSKGEIPGEKFESDRPVRRHPERVSGHGNAAGVS